MAATATIAAATTRAMRNRFRSMTHLVTSNAAPDQHGERFSYKRRSRVPYTAVLRISEASYAE
jgi:hypothetical protein